MRKITPMILVTLMLVSALSSFDFAELEETEVIEDAGARAGIDAELVAITNPKESVCLTGATDCRNVMKVGDLTEFSSYIMNSGDSDISEMGYSVTVYNSDASGNPSQISKDAAGLDLTWENDSVICATSCPDTTLGVGDVLGGGKHVMAVDGNAIVWEPTRGLYVVEIIINAVGDTDVGNDAQQIFVVVEDWYDIDLELTWSEPDGSPSADEVASGSGTKDWTLTVTADGSDTFEPRDVHVRIQTVGDVLIAQDLDGNTITRDTTHIYTAGTPNQFVETYQNLSTEPPTITNSTSGNVLTTWTLQGSLTVDAADTDNAAYGMHAELVNFTQYGPYCTITWQDPNDPEAEEEVYENFCESEMTKDAYPSSDETTIEGFASIYHDMRISQIAVVQGYNADGTGQATSMVSDTDDSELNVGASYLWVELEHRGSEPESIYEWAVNFSVTDAGGAVIQESNVTTCDNVEPASPVYQPLGAGLGATIFATACMMVDLSMDGEHTFAAQLISTDKVDDAKPSNNNRGMTLNVRNNAPLITSLDVMNEGDLFIGQPEMLQMTVQVFDVDDPSATNLEVEWTNLTGADLPGCDRAVMQVTCSILILDSYVTDFIVTVTVYDAHGGETSKELEIKIWNDGAYSTSTDSGLTMSYSMLFWGVNPFIFTVNDGEAVTNQQLEGYTGLYDSVGVIDYVPSNIYDSNNVLSQSLEVEVNKSLGATSLWYVHNSQWLLLSAQATDTSALTEKFSYTLASELGVLESGSMVLFGGSLAQAEAPSASITGFSAAPLVDGAIQINWDVTGTMLSGDSITVTICEVVNCTESTEARPSSDSRGYKQSGQQTTHGVNYSIVVAICNEVGCNPTIGSGTVIADNAVDGGAAATDLTIADSGTAWTIAWNTSGVQDDVDSWRVCYDRSSFTAAQIGEIVCVPVSNGTSVVIDNSNLPAGTFTYYFSAMPVDALGNTVDVGSMNQADFDREDVINQDDGTTVGEKVSSGVPTWTWGVIGGVVVVAFIAGAFILSRGGSGDEGKDWDY